MRLTILAAGAALTLASAPAYAQLANSGNLLTTTGQQPNFPGVPHQSSTMVNAAGGTRGEIVGVNGGDLAPGVQASKAEVLPAQARSSTPSRSAGAYVQVAGQPGGPSNGALARVAVTSNLGAGPSQTYREAGVHTPATAGGGLGGNLTSAVPAIAAGALPTK